MKQAAFISIKKISQAVLFTLATQSFNAYAAQPVQNGDFETGNLSGWKATSINGGFVQVVRKGSCFSSNDTSKLPIKGNYAVILRSNASGSTRSEAVLTSNAFIAGDGFAFAAMSESADLIKADNPSKFEVEVLDAEDDNVLIAYDFIPRVIRLAEGCPSEARSQPLTAHYFSTKAFANEKRSIKIRFRQKTRVDSYGFFTLIDQVAKFNEGETPSFYGRPVAMAGISNTRSGTPMLDPRGSFNPDHFLYSLKYTWTINKQGQTDDTDTRHFRKPCINNITTGDYRAVLYVSDGQHVMADPLTFSIATSFTGDNASDASSDDAVTSLPTDVTGPVGNDPECSVGIVNGVDPTDPSADIVIPDVDVDVNNPHDLFGDVTPITSASSTNDSSGSTTDTGTDDTDTGSDTGDTDDTNQRSTVSTQASLDATTILWKPVSEGDGNLVVLTPNFFEELNLSILDSSGKVIDQGDFVGRTNGDRPTYRFSRPGANYPSPSILRVGNTRYLVSNPSQRVN